MNYAYIRMSLAQMAKRALCATLAAPGVEEDARLAIAWRKASICGCQPKALIDATSAITIADVAEEAVVFWPK